MLTAARAGARIGRRGVAGSCRGGWHSIGTPRRQARRRPRRRSTRQPRDLRAAPLSYRDAGLQRQTEPNSKVVSAACGTGGSKVIRRGASKQ